MFIYYDESLLTLLSSIRNYFHLNSFYPSDRDLDVLMTSKRPEHILMVSINGLGADEIKSKLAPQAFLNRNFFKKVQTVLASDEIELLSGKSFNMLEHQMISDEDINKLDIDLDGLDNLSLTSNINLVEIDEYEKVVREYGLDADETLNYLKRLDIKLESLANKISNDAMLIVFSKYGLCLVDKIYELKDSKYENYFSLKPDLSSRLMNFHIKSEYLDDFAKEFKKDFEDYFILLNKHQVIDSKLFGYGENDTAFESFLGDYVAIAKSTMALTYGDSVMPVSHGGILDSEVYVPFIIYQK